MFEERIIEASKKIKEFKEAKDATINYLKLYQADSEDLEKYTNMMDRKISETVKDIQSLLSAEKFIDDFLES